MKNKIIAFLLLITSVLYLCSCTEEPNIAQLNSNISGALKVHFIDVGQGDCALLESNGKYVLIDAGEVEYADTVCDYLKSCEVITIDYVIATHPHSDHCGGLAQVINTFDCKNFITSETDQQTSTWLNVLYAVDDNNVNYIDAKVSDTYTFGETTFEILGPCKDNYEDYNNYSVVLKATCGNTSFLFTGDAETTSENDMLQNGANLKADVLKVGHHGSYTSTGSKFLKAVSPAYAVISCGKNNEYGHPHKEVTSALQKHNVTTYRTDVYSTIIACTDKENITFYYKNTEISAPTHQSTEDPKYIGNKSSKKFHSSECSGVENMSENNKVEFYSRDEAINSGYTPCKQCNP